MNVSRNAEQFAGVEELEFVSALIALNEHEQFAEDLGEVATIDLVNDEEVCVLLVVVGGFLAEGIERPLHQLESRAGGAVSLDEILVGVALVELNKFDARNVLEAHHRVCEAFGDECLTNTGRTLQDDVLLCFEQAHDRVVLIAVHVDSL